MGYTFAIGEIAVADYKRMYKTLFNAVTDALEELHVGEIVEAEYL